MQTGDEAKNPDRAGWEYIAQCESTVDPDPAYLRQLHIQVFVSGTTDTFAKANRSIAQISDSLYCEFVALSAGLIVPLCRFHSVAISLL